MKTKFCPLAVVVALCAVSAARADLYNQQLTHGSSHGVSFSWLHFGSDANGVVPDPADLWRISGQVQVDYDAAANTLDLHAPATLSVLDGDMTQTLGSLEVLDLHLDGNAAPDGLLGWIDIRVNANPGTHLADRADSDVHRVQFLNKHYGSSGSHFNGFRFDDDELEIRLWGNENMYPVATGGGWGMDWSSSGLPQAVPSPSAAALGMVGLALLSRRRRLFI